MVIGEFGAMVYYEVEPGENVHDVAQKAVDYIKEHGGVVSFKFNGIDLFVCSYDGAGDIVRRYHSSIRDLSRVRTR